MSKTVREILSKISPIQKLSSTFISATGHQHTKTDRKEATCTETGYEDKICTDCGATVSHTILPALGHTYEDGICTRCGEENSNPHLLGDISDNNEINATDYLLLKRFCLGTFTLTDEQKAVADVNGDGEINALDYMLVKRHVLGTYKIA